MQARGTEIKARGQFDRINIKTLAILRAQEVTDQGGDPKPWLDPDRDFFGEELEELADAWNYNTWNMKKNGAYRHLLLKLARYLVEVAYDLVIMAERVSGNTIKKGE